MGKFLLIRCSHLSANERKKLETKFTASKLKELFKCSSVIELSPQEEPKSQAKKITNIDVSILRKLCYEFLSKDHDDNAFDDGRLAKKLFIFSDDADISSLMFSLIADNEYHFNYFEIDQDESEELIEAIDEISDFNYTKQQANEAKDLYESLRSLEYDLEIDLVSRYADDELDEKIEDCEQEIQNRRDKVTEIISSKWEPPVEPKPKAKKNQTSK
jgi:uncharacterized membrane protein YgaE (UPF0421/DUF939 family)